MRRVITYLLIILYLSADKPRLELAVYSSVRRGFDSSAVTSGTLNRRDYGRNRTFEYSYKSSNTIRRIPIAFYRAVHYSALHGIAILRVCLSVCL